MSGFVIYIREQDDHELWKRSEELPRVYMSEDAAHVAIIEFLLLADDAGFGYHSEEFKVEAEVYFCPYCGKQHEDEDAACCGEKGHCTTTVPEEFK